MATSENDRRPDDSENRRRAARNRKIEPPRKAPSTERKLTHSPYFNGPRYQRMSEDLHLGGMSKQTHEGYLRAVRQLADFCKLSPDQITEDQLRKFFLHLKNDKEFAGGSLRVAFSGVKFFYTRTCRRDWQTLAQMKIQNVQSLPEVLTCKRCIMTCPRSTKLTRRDGRCLCCWLSTSFPFYCSIWHSVAKIGCDDLTQGCVYMVNYQTDQRKFQPLSELINS